MCIVLFDCWLSKCVLCVCMFRELWLVFCLVDFVGRWQSGQMQRTVNPPLHGYVGSNPTLPILCSSSSIG